MLKKRCVVFGGGGFIGSHLTEALVAKNYDVLVYARGSNKDFQNLNDVLNKITFVKGDLQNINLIKKIIRPEDFVFNLISSSVPVSSMNKPVDEVRYHIFQHVLLAQTIFKIGIQKYIFASSGGGVYGQKRKLPISETASPSPSSPHAIAKASIEYFTTYFSRLYSKPCLIFRISNPYGKRQAVQKGFGIVPTIITHIKNRTSPILFNNGSIIRDFIYIDDLIDAITLSFDKKTKYNLYNIGTGKGTTIKKIWTILKRLLEVKLEPIYAEKRPIDADKVILDISRFSREFNWKPKFDINTGLKKTIANLYD